MNNLQRAFLLTFIPLTAAPLAALPDPAAKEIKENAKRLAEWQRQPREFARLRRAAETFAAMPAERREQILKLHRQLEQTPAASQARLLHSLEAYVEWLGTLEPEVRKKIQQATNKSERLRLIREQRDKEWLRGQPEAFRKQVAKLPPAEQRKRIDEARAAERQRRHEWTIAARFWDELGKKNVLPTHLIEFTPEVQTYVTDYLLPRLDDAEKARLQAAEGLWPLYPLTLVELADRHPIALADKHWPRFIKDLGRDLVERRLRIRTGMNVPKQILAAEGKSSTEFVQAIVSYVHKRGNNFQLPPGLWPIEYQSLNNEMQEFVDKTLLPVLDIDEKFRLDHASGRWPDYPQTINDLAHKHDLRPPWNNLPGSAKVWDKYR